MTNFQNKLLSYLILILISGVVSFLWFLGVIFSSTGFFAIPIAFGGMLLSPIVVVPSLAIYWWIEKQFKLPKISKTYSIILSIVIVIIIQIIGSSIFMFVGKYYAMFMNRNFKIEARLMNEKVTLSSQDMLKTEGALYVYEYVLEVDNQSNKVFSNLYSRTEVVSLRPKGEPGGRSNFIYSGGGIEEIYLTKGKNILKGSLPLHAAIGIKGGRYNRSSLTYFEFTINDYPYSFKYKTPTSINWEPIWNEQKKLEAGGS